MVVRVIEAKEDKVTMADLIADLKKSNKIDYSGAIFTFEGIVRGKEENMNLEKLILTTPDKEKTLKDIENIVEDAKIKFNVFEISVIHYIGEFYTGDSLFLVAVLGGHRGESLDALKEVIEKVKYDVEFKKEENSFERKLIQGDVLPETFRRIPTLRTQQRYFRDQKRKDETGCTGTYRGELIRTLPYLFLLLPRIIPQPA